MSSEAAPFGTYAPEGLQAWARARANGLRSGQPGKWLRSILLRLAGGKARKPRDVVVFGDQRARLHPYDNICEKRVYAGAQLWDALERAALAEAICAHDGENFMFADIGANVGLYSLFARSVAREAGRAIRLLCVEPEPVVRARMAFNLRASGALDEAAVLDWAIGPKSGEVSLYVNEKNRGENRLDGAGDPVRVAARPLIDAFGAAGFDRVDAMKIDIEGAERPALEAFFRTAPAPLWPRLIILETAHDRAEESALKLCLEHGYSIAVQTRLNAILKLA
ncbi:MAG: FkbM family methyltransferase [Parvularculaceae bacterium]